VLGRGGVCVASLWVMAAIDLEAVADAIQIGISDAVAVAVVVRFGPHAGFVRLSGVGVVVAGVVSSAAMNLDFVANPVPVYVTVAIAQAVQVGLAWVFAGPGVRRSEL
jgi:hypothetical protein